MTYVRHLKHLTAYKRTKPPTALTIATLLLTLPLTPAAPVIALNVALILSLHNHLTLERQGWKLES